MTRALVVSVVIVGAAAAIAAQQRDATTQPPPVAAAPATAMISGAVIDATSSAPVRRAIVTVSGDGVIGGRSAITDDAGRFAIAQLPAGRYSISAIKAGYLTTAFGAKRPGRPGVSQALAAGERLAIELRMSRGAVLSGTVTDERGAPAAGVRVTAMDTRDQAISGPSAGQFVKTDDRGAFRIFGLAPGEYVIAAVSSPVGSGAIVARSTEEVDAVLSAIAQRSTGAGVAPAPRPNTPPSRPRTVNLAPVYYPGTPAMTEATRVTLGAGEERAGLSFALTPVPVVAIRGVVVGGPATSRVELSIIAPTGPRASPTFGLGAGPVLSTPIDASGVFGYTNIAPGHYTIMARALPSSGAPPPAARGGGGGFAVGGVSGPGGAANSREALYAVADVDVLSQDVEGVTLTLQPGTSWTGRVAFEGTSATPGATELSQVRVSITPPDGSGMSSSNGTIMGNAFRSVSVPPLSADGTFRVDGIAPGPYVVRPTVTGELAKTWALKSVTAGDHDLLEETIAVQPGTPLPELVLTFTDRHSEVAGMLEPPAGGRGSDYFIVAIPADRTKWVRNSRRMQIARPASDGQFSIKDLPAGDYLIAAVTDAEPSDLNDRPFLDALAGGGVRVTVEEGRRVVQNFRVSGGR